MASGFRVDFLLVLALNVDSDNALLNGSLELAFRKWKWNRDGKLEKEKKENITTLFR